MALSLVTGSASIGTTEFWLASNSTTKVDQTESVYLEGWIDFGAMVAGDEYEWRIVEKVNGGTQRTVVQDSVIGAQNSPVILPSYMLGDGWEIGVKRIAGTDRSIGWSLRKLTDVVTRVDDAASIDATEYWLASDSTTKVDQTQDVLLQPWLDFGALTDTEVYEWRLVEKVNAGTQRDVMKGRLLGVQNQPLVLPTLFLGEGWEIGVIRIVGSVRSIAWSLRKVL